MKNERVAAVRPGRYGRSRGCLLLLAACLTTVIANAAGTVPPQVANVGPGVGPSVSPGVDPSVGPRVGPGVGPGIGPGVGPSVGPGVGPSVGSSVGPGVGPSVRPSVEEGAPGVLSRASDLGSMSSSSPIDLTVWLNVRDGAGLDRTLEAQRSSGAGWLSEAQIDQLHAPAAADVDAVRTFLKSKGLTVTGVGAHHLFVKATGTVAAVDAAFKVQLHQYTFRGTTFHASRVRPTLPESIAPLVASVGGLSDLTAKPMLVHLGPGAWTNVQHPADILGTPWRLVPLSATSTGADYFTPQCFYPPTTLSFSSSTATATYSGARYGANITNTAPGTLPPCGYQPSDLQTAYNLTPLYKAGLDGTGETIAIIDPYGSTTLQQDLARFSALMGLPPANLQVLGTPTATNFSTDPTLRQWAGETTLDVEWAHAIAPGANILLVVAPSASLDDLMAANLTAAQQRGVVSICNSWGYFESFSDLPSRQAADATLKLAASRGISVNFASGDYGNGALALGYADVDYPASSPYATAVGGVTVALDQNKHILFQTAWGTNLVIIANVTALGSPPVDPPSPGGLTSGGGGGMSDVYPLPPFQAFLRGWGTRRLVPDISWVADPFTGVEVVITVDPQGDQGVGLDGGTSVATPMFSALWSIAVQKARRPLGQAAPLLYALPPWAITDVVAPTPFANVTGTLTDATGTQQLTAEDLSVPLQGQPNFISTLYNAPGTAWWVLTFGVDSKLQAGPGWDPATGLGTPNGAAFVNAFSR